MNRAERRASERKTKGGHNPPGIVIRATRRTGDEQDRMLQHMARMSEKKRTEEALRSKQVKGF